MSTVQAQIEIAAPIDRVWETIMDPRRLGDWVTIHRSVSEISQMPLREGSTMRQTVAVRGVSFHVQWRLASLRAPHSAHWEGGGPARSTAVIRYELTPGPDRATLFRYTNEFHPPGGALGNVAGRVIVGGISEREAHASLLRLKALLEGD
ncbi:MAG: SRPBCC family protein [Solirubrobacterales bacterium]|nr:SRPBCC family protein [Solirubrobacterales bacterium]